MPLVLSTAPVSKLTREEPMMVVGAALNITVVMVAAFSPAWHLSPTQMAAVSTISTAITSLIASLLVTPVSLGVVNSAITTILVACAAFGLHLPPASVALVAGEITALLSYFMREKVTAVANIPSPRHGAAR